MSRRDHLFSMRIQAHKTLSSPVHRGPLMLCALLPIWTAQAAQPTPYLLVCAPPPLRHAQPLPPPPEPGVRVCDHAEDPATVAEEIAALNQQSALGLPAVASDAAATGPAPAGPPAATGAAAAPGAPGVTAAAGDQSAIIVVEPPAAGVSILPDDTPVAVRAEDVLLFFRFPGNRPAQGLPPPSTATYSQQ